MSGVSDAFPHVPKQPSEAVKPVVMMEKPQQPWRAVWPAKAEENLPDQRNKDLGVPHYQLSGGRSAEFGYNDEAQAESVNEQKQEPTKKSEQK